MSGNVALTCGVTLGSTRRSRLGVVITRRLIRTLRLSPDAGQSALELAITVPVVIVMLLVVIAFGRVTQSRQLVDEAAATASRAASLAGTPAQAESQARQSVTLTLSQAGLSCSSSQVQVGTEEFRPGGQVTVTVRCTATLTGMALTGLPGDMTLTATARTPLENYRDFGATS
jgi:Flp pilus assembly protein TadG